MYRVLCQKNNLTYGPIIGGQVNVDHPCEQQRKGLYNYANIPLDKKSLTAIGKLFYGIVVSNNPSMGLIQDVDTYNFLQSQIFQLTSSMNVPNLVFDYYAWDMNH